MSARDWKALGFERDRSGVWTYMGDQPVRMTVLPTSFTGGTTWSVSATTVSEAAWDTGWRQTVTTDDSFRGTEAEVLAQVRALLNPSLLDSASWNGGAS